MIWALAYLIKHNLYYVHNHEIFDRIKFNFNDFKFYFLLQLLLLITIISIETFHYNRDLNLFPSLLLFFLSYCMIMQLSIQQKSEKIYSYNKYIFFICHIKKLQ